MAPAALRGMAPAVSIFDFRFSVFREDLLDWTAAAGLVQLPVRLFRVAHGGGGVKRRRRRTTDYRR